MIDDPFIESVERKVSLPNIHPRTFRHFLAYDYHSSNCAELRYEPHLQSEPTIRFPKSKLVELLLEEGHKKFKCKACFKPHDLKPSRSFPLCGSCSQDNNKKLSWNENCIVNQCSNSARFLQGLICEGCLRGAGVLDWGGQFIPAEATDYSKNLL